jgi:transcriptional regulator of acetoin/glycerol metabolism
MAEADRRAHAAWLDHLFAQTGGNVSQAAQRAGIARESLHRMARRYGVDPEVFRRMRG